MMSVSKSLICDFVHVFRQASATIACSAEPDSFRPTPYTLLDLDSMLPFNICILLIISSVERIISSSNSVVEQSSLYLSKTFPFSQIYAEDVSWLVERKRQRDSELQALQRRRKRYVVRKKRWRHNLLTWRIDTSNIKKEDEYVVRATLHRAFQEWSAVSNVRFEEVADKSADIVIGFERGKHQDDFPFDGKDGIVAHAFYPRDGRLHFDADEDWSLNSATGTAVHEIGHLLGLEHSVDPRAVMYPAKRPYNSDFTLEDDDVRAVRILFPSEEEFKTYEKKKSPHLNEADRDRETNLPVIVENLHGGLSQEKFNNTNMEFIFPFPLPQLHQK
ncbi:hypothetical protein RB195_010463 [Necator americanus]|uniref:Peptidase metallopeptidase domain-containing protein n=1 Tax=Necator americanus TaxID=51031 RepID=A0ABR1D1C6_NECAM